jgi:glutathione S-transferase
MTDIEIIGAPQSPFVRAARMACAEKGVSYRLTPALPHTPEVDCIHPCGKIPVMRYGDFELCESKAIASFVDRAFPGPKLFPDDAKLWAKVEQWVSIVSTAVVPSVIPYFGAHFFPKTPDARPDPEAIAKALPGVRASIETLEKAVANKEYLAGNDFTYADIALMPILAYLHDLPESGPLLAGAKALAEYFNRHSARMSFKATVPPPFSDLRTSAA